MERFERSRVGFGGVDPRVLFIPERPGVTSLIGVAHRSDRCSGYVGFASGERLVSFLLSLVVGVSSLVSFGAW
jgi:hypothetical protein